MKPADILRIDAITRTVTDLGAAERFYREAMDFASVAGPVPGSAADAALLDAAGSRLTRQAVQLGGQTIQFLSFDPSGDVYPPDSTSTDLWFQHCAIVVSDMSRAFDRVMAAGARPISADGPQTLPANTGGVSAFKFRDPFGHPLELLHFPQGVGDAARRGASAALFRGIDHTAIAVSSCADSSQFYVDLLGLKPTGQSHNRGPAQTRLDAVPADDVDVEALAPSQTPPHLELLGYRTGRRRPLEGAEASDAAVARTIATGAIDAIAERLTQAGRPAPRCGTWDGTSAIAFADPDGHEWICQAGA